MKQSDDITLTECALRVAFGCYVLVVDLGEHLLLSPEITIMGDVPAEGTAMDFSFSAVCS